jgi:AhpD family alkylhydroperoxidase
LPPRTRQQSAGITLKTPISGLETAMTSFPIHTIDTAPEESRETLRTVQETLGMIPNLAAAMAESPTLVRAFFAVRETYSQGTLSPIDIQVLSLTNAFENGCEWCMAFHSAVALKEGLSKKALEALRAGRAPEDRRLGALSDLSRAMVRNRGEVSEQDLKAFYAAGFSRAQALEVVLGVAFSVMANFSEHLVHAPLGAAFEPHAWSRPRQATEALR